MAATLEPVAPTKPGYPPGPPSGFAWLGNVGPYRSDPLAFLEQLATYGDVTHVRFWRQHTYFVYHPEHVEHVLVREPKRYGKSPLLRQFDDVLGKGLLLSEGDLWRRQRKLMAPTFTPQAVEAFADYMTDCAAEVSAGWTSGETYDVGEEMIRLSLSVAIRSLFGVNLDRDVRDVGVAFSTVSDYYQDSVGTWQWPGFLPTARNRAFRAARGELEQIVRRLIAKRRASPGVGPDLLGVLLAAQSGDARGMSDTQLKDEVQTLLLSGHETTALTLTYVLRVLAHHPQVLERLQTQLSSVLGKRTPVPSDLEQLPLLKQVVRETMRLYPAVGTLGRVTTTEDAIGGWRIPVGSFLFIPIWVIQRDPRFYPDPLVFRPERWEDGLPDLPRFAYFPFGGGHRVCIAEAFALLELHLVLASLLVRWTPTPVDDRPLRLTQSVTLRPLEPVRLRFTARTVGQDFRREA